MRAKDRFQKGKIAVMGMVDGAMAILCGLGKRKSND